MHTSKRKFQTLLNGLGTKSLTNLNDVNNESNGNLPQLGDLRTKRFRTGRPGTTSSTVLGKFSRPRTSERVSANKKSAVVEKVNPSAASHTQAPTDTEDGPKYNPYDREAFLARLKTYSRLLDWSQKPARVEGPEWAKRGWTCQKNERVRCDYCYAEIVVKINIKEINGVEEHIFVASEIEESLVDKYAGLIITGHSEDCPWSQRGCGDSIFHLSLNNAPITLKSIRDRYDSLCVIADKLPYLHNMNIREGYSLDQVLESLPNDFFESVNGETESAPPDVNRVAIFMALCGWQGDKGMNSAYGSASCSSCFRNLGLWLFKSKSVNEDETPVDPATMNNLDPIGEHRDYCPWKSGQSQSGPAKSDTVLLAAWEVVMRVLKNNNYLMRNKSSDRTQILSATTGSRPATSYTNNDQDDEDYEKVRGEQDKNRHGRLHKIMRLFDTNTKNKLQKERDSKSTNVSQRNSIDTLKETQNENRKS